MNTLARRIATLVAALALTLHRLIQTPTRPAILAHPCSRLIRTHLTVAPGEPQRVSEPAILTPIHMTQHRTLTHRKATNDAHRELEAHRRMRAIIIRRAQHENRQHAAPYSDTAHNTLDAECIHVPQSVIIRDSDNHTLTTPSALHQTRQNHATNAMRAPRDAPQTTLPLLQPRQLRQQQATTTSSTHPPPIRHKKNARRPHGNNHHHTDDTPQNPSNPYQASDRASNAATWSTAKLRADS